MAAVDISKLTDEQLQAYQALRSKSAAPVDTGQVANPTNPKPPSIGGSGADRSAMRSAPLAFPAMAKNGENPNFDNSMGALAETGKTMGALSLPAMGPSLVTSPAKVAAGFAAGIPVQRLIEKAGDLLGFPGTGQAAGLVGGAAAGGYAGRSTPDMRSPITLRSPGPTDPMTAAVEHALPFKLGMLSRASRGVQLRSPLIPAPIEPNIAGPDFGRSVEVPLDPSDVRQPTNRQPLWNDPSKMNQGARRALSMPPETGTDTRPIPATSLPSGRAPVGGVRVPTGQEIAARVPLWRQETPPADVPELTRSSGQPARGLTVRTPATQPAAPQQPQPRTPLQPIISETPATKGIDPVELNMRIADETRRAVYQNQGARNMGIAEAGTDPSSNTAQGANVDEIVQRNRANWAQKMAKQLKNAGKTSADVEALTPDMLDRISGAAGISPASSRSPATHGLFREYLDNMWKAAPKARNPLTPPAASEPAAKAVRLFRSNANSEIGDEGHWASADRRYPEAMGGTITELGDLPSGKVADLSKSGGYTPEEAIRALKKTFPSASSKDISSLIDIGQWVPGDKQHYDLPDLIHANNEQPGAILKKLSSAHGYSAIKFKEQLPGGGDLAYEGKRQKPRVDNYFIGGK